MEMDLYTLVTVVLVLTSVFAYVNLKFLKLPEPIGIMILSLSTSLLIILIGFFNEGFFTKVTDVIRTLNFRDALMRGMLSYLLFAGALRIDLRKLQKERVPVALFASIGVIISAAVCGAGLYYVSGLLGIEIPFLYCLLFGSLISPTDPVAVMSVLRKAGIPNRLETRIAGESLFNDGMGVVLVATIVDILDVTTGPFSLGNSTWLFLRETGGGLGLGLILGYSAYYALKTLDNYVVEVLITVAIVTGGYFIAELLHVSGLFAMVVAGIITGNKTMGEQMSDVTRDYVDKFWEMVDEVMNTILFLLMGFVMLIVSFSVSWLWLGLLCVIIVLFARWISILIPVAMLKRHTPFGKNEVPVLTWAGLRGGISLALALSLPVSPVSDLLLTLTYIVVVFSMLVQGLTVGKFARKLLPPKEPAPVPDLPDIRN